MSRPVADRGEYRFERLTADRVMLSFPANDGHVAHALHDLAGHLRGMGCPSPLLDELRIVLAEVLNNVEEHAYAGQSGGSVTVELSTVGNELRCVVEDQGRQFLSGSLPTSTMPASDPDTPDTLPEGGFGWPLVHKLTSNLEYARHGDTNRLGFSLSARTPMPPASSDTP